MVTTTNAIVLSTKKYGEADLIATCYTASDGVKTYMLRGILKSKKGKIRASHFQLLTQLEIEANHKNKGTLEYLKDAKIAVPYQTLHTDIVKSCLVMFLSEILTSTIREEESNNSLYNFISKSLETLDHAEEFANFHIYFLLQLSTYLGFYPDDNNMELPYFNLLDGLFQDEVTNIYCEKGENIEKLKVFFGIKFDDAMSEKLTKNQRSNLLIVLLQYYQLHVQGFRKPKSLEVLQQLFN
ncbi:DNA repair protein [unidentified eubacterium SCB49]|nr:DNA repair protein [unidentified eubacterium SCB49]